MLAQAALFCLSLNTYYEARSEPFEGQVAVANVVINRAIKQQRSICYIVYKDRQFSWRLTPQNKPYGEEWLKAKFIAQFIILAKDNTNGADHYYASYIAKPKWAYHLEHTVTIGQHIFFKDLNDRKGYYKVSAVHPFVRKILQSFKLRLSQRGEQGILQNTTCFKVLKRQVNKGVTYC